MCLLVQIPHQKLKVRKVAMSEIWGYLVGSSSSVGLWIDLFQATLISCQMKFLKTLNIPKDAWNSSDHVSSLLLIWLDVACFKVIYLTVTTVQWRKIGYTVLLGHWTAQVHTACFTRIHKTYWTINRFAYKTESQSKLRLKLHLLNCVSASLQVCTSPNIWRQFEVCFILNYLKYQIQKLLYHLSWIIDC